jgi:hypothetical protein
MELVRIGGGIQGADKETWLKYEILWDGMLKKYFASSRFAGQDQCIIGSIYLDNPGLFHLIPAPGVSGGPGKFPGDKWFYLLYYWK